jgi:phage-related protein
MKQSEESQQEAVQKTDGRFEIEFYETKDGKQPVKEFLLSLDVKMRAKMLSMISLLQDNGYELREPYSKHLSDGIFELRAKVGSDITRVLYFFCVERHIILTNGFIKKTQKTPPKEIDRAKKYRTDYLCRKEIRK